MLGVEGTAKRLGEALSLLTRAAPDLPERQRSLRATVDWSVRLLDPPARHVLTVFAAFPGGARLEALEAVADPGTDVATALEVLLDASLVTHAMDAGGEPRFGMLETIRAYAADELDREDAEHVVRRRQLEWCIVLAEGDDPRHWLRATPWRDSVEPELANIRAALDFARVEDDIAGELRLASAMRHYWRVRGHGVEGRRRLEDVLARSEGADAVLRARAKAETAVLRTAAGEYEDARALWLEALDTYREAGDAVEVGRMHAELGVCAMAAGGLQLAIEHYEAARDTLAAEDEEFVLQIVLGNLAEVYEKTGDLERARATALDVLEAQHRLGDRDGVAFTSYTLAGIALTGGDLVEAHVRLVECLTTADEVGYVELIAYALGLAAVLALELGRLDESALLMGASEETFQQTASSPQAYEAARFRIVVAVLRERLDGADGAIERGRSLGLESAVELASGLGERVTA